VVRLGSEELITKWRDRFLYVRQAAQALDLELYNATALYCMLALESFIMFWFLAIQGSLEPDIPLVIPDGISNPFEGQQSRDYRRLPGVTSVTPLDLVSDFFYSPSLSRLDRAKIRQANFTLFKKVEKGDVDWLFGRMIRMEGAAEQDKQLICAVRRIRNFYCHYEPYGQTFTRFQKACDVLGVEGADPKHVCNRILETTCSLLEQWNSRYEKRFGESLV
jgi:hypothetical protein